MYNGTHSEISDILEREKLKVNFIVLDLGLSTYHLKEANRGFSFRDQKLDMRFDQNWGISTLELVNKFTYQKLASLIFDYGEERHSRKIARSIVNNRPFSSSLELAENIRKTLKQSHKYRQKIDLATKTFQALRIASNHELNFVEKSIVSLPSYLKEGGSLAVISFHSLEDRIVKHHFKKIGIVYSKKKAKEAQFLIKTPKPIRPQLDEINKNPASHSACLRVLTAQRGT